MRLFSLSREARVSATSAAKDLRSPAFAALFRSVSCLSASVQCKTRGEATSAPHLESVLIPSPPAVSPLVHFWHAL